MDSIIPQLIANSIIAGALYALVALGFNLIFGTAKFFDLGYGALSAIGGYMVFLFAKQLGLPLSLSIIIAIVISGLVSWGLYKTVYLPLLRRKASSMVLLVASLGVLTAIQAIIAIFFTSQFQTLPWFGEVQPREIFGAIITDVQIVSIVLVVVIMIVLELVLKYTMFGKAVKAVSDDEEVARVVGIQTKKVTAKIFMIAGAVAGLAGIFAGFDTGIEPTMGLGLLLKGVIAAIVGGVGNVMGGVLGALLLGFVENFGIWKISGEWKDAIAFGLLIIFLLFRPGGILKK